MQGENLKCFSLSETLMLVQGLGGTAMWPSGHRSGTFFLLATIQALPSKLVCKAESVLLQKSIECHYTRLLQGS